MFRVPFSGASILRLVLAFAGILCLSGGLAGFFVDPRFFIVPALVGGMEVFFAATGYCPLAAVLRAVGTPCRMTDGR